MTERQAQPIQVQAVLVFLAALIVFQAAILYLDNVHIATSNGMYKAILMEPWIADPAKARLDQSNYLYFPLYGLLCRLLDLFGIWRGVPWKQIAVLNGFWAAICVTFVYVFIRRLTGNAWAAALAACFHAGSGFVLLLAVINEDIMSGYTLVLGSMALAAIWFVQPTAKRVFVVAVVFTIGWLIEWRLIFPTLPALILAVLIAETSLRRRLQMIGLLVIVIVAVAGLASLATEGHHGGMGLHDLLWTGKGIGTGWGGFSWDKLWLLLSGVSNYFLYEMLAWDPGATRDNMWRFVPSVVVQIALLASVIVAMRRKIDARIRTVAAVFLGTAAAGTVFNLYSQPQDPQMQINVMPWLTVTWGLFAMIVLQARFGSLAMRRGVLLVASVVPMVWSLATMSSDRGGDSRWMSATRELELAFPPDRTVFLVYGFEPITFWQFALWSHTWDWAQAGAPPPAPSATPKFKWITVNSGALFHRQRTPAEDAATLKAQINKAFDMGYQVVAAHFWNWGVEELAGTLGALSAADRAEALHAMLHGAYDGELTFVSDMAGGFFQLRRRNDKN